MSPDRTLLLVGGTDETVRAAADLGLHILLLQHPTKLTAPQRALAGHVEVLDFTDWSLVEPVVRRLHDAYRFRVALSLTEPGLENAGRINDLLGLGGTGFDAAHVLRDKAEMRARLAATDPAAVGAAVLRDRRSLTDFGTRYGYPFIVKPADATASFGVFRVGGPQEADRVWAEVQRMRGRRTDRGTTLFLIQEFVLEEYVDGPEFSVESFSFGGRHVVVAVTEKFVAEDAFIELGHAVPARIDETLRERIRESVARFLDVVGIRDGVCHTELRIGPRGPAVIEGHNRVAGDLIPDLVRAAYGIDLLRYAIGWPFGLVDELPDRPEALRGASTRAVVADPGTVESVDGVERARALDDVIDVRVTARPGDTVRVRRDNWDRLGLVAVGGADATDAVRRGAEVIDEVIRIRVTGPDGRTHYAHVAAEPVAMHGTVPA
jgi:biotin carboxylase